MKKMLVVLIEMPPILVIVIAVIVIALFVVFVIIPIFFAISWHAHKVWCAVALPMGLSYHGNFLGPSFVQGIYRKRPLSLFVVTRRYTPQYTHCVVAVHNPRDFTFLLLEKTVLIKIDSLFSSEASVRMKSMPELEKRFLLRTSSETELVTLLHSTQLQQGLLQIDPLNIKLDGARLIYERKGMERDPERIQAIFNVLIDLAEAVEFMSANELRDIGEENLPVKTNTAVLPTWIQKEVRDDFYLQWYLQSKQEEPITREPVSGIWDIVELVVVIFVLFVLVQLLLYFIS